MRQRRRRARPGRAGRRESGAGRRRRVVVLVPASSPGAAAEPWRRRRSQPEQNVSAGAATIETHARRVPLGLAALPGRSARAPSARSLAFLPCGRLRHGVGVGGAGGGGAGLRQPIPAGEQHLSLAPDPGPQTPDPGFGIRDPGPAVPAGCFRPLPAWSTRRRGLAGRAGPGAGPRALVSVRGRRGPGRNLAVKNPTPVMSPAFSRAGGSRSQNSRL